MAIKVEITQIQNSHNNKVTSYNEIKDTTTNKPKRTLNKTYVVPKENTDEFVTKIKKAERNKLITAGLGFLAGCGIAIGFGLKLSKKHLIDWNLLGWAGVISGILTGTAASYIFIKQAEKLMQKLNVKETTE